MSVGQQGLAAVDTTDIPRKFILPLMSVGQQGLAAVDTNYQDEGVSYPTPRQ